MAWAVKETLDSVPSRLLQELPSRQSMLVGVITSVSKLMTQTLAIQGTWGPRAPEVIFFVGEVSSIPHLPPKMKIVQLEGVEDGERGRELKEAHAIKHMADQYLDTVDWFLVVGDETYLRPAALEKKLSSIDARYQIYMGRPGAGMDQQGVGKGSLCHREPGVVYSRAMMESLRQYLPTCWPGGRGYNTRLHHQHASQVHASGRGKVSLCVGVVMYAYLVSIFVCAYMQEEWFTCNHVVECM